MAKPHLNPNRVTRNEVKECASEQVYSDSTCELCSDNEFDIKHTHMSSEGVRRFALNRKKQMHMFQCIMCKQQESTVRPSTRKIILTDSSLYNVWSDSSLNTSDHHMEIEAVVGGRIRNLTRAIITMYLKNAERLEIILIAGINNIGEGQTVPEILEEISELKELLSAHSVVHSHDPPSMVSVSTLLYAPRFCSLDVPDSQQAWKPPRGFVNKRREIECLNVAIAAVNRGWGVNYLKLHLEGIRIDKKAKRVMHKHNPERPIWRETDIFRRLHMSPAYKVRIVNLAKKIFSGGMSKLGDW